MGNGIADTVVRATLLSAVPWLLWAQEGAVSRTPSDRGVWSDRTFEFSGAVLRAASPFSDVPSFGINTQLSKRHSRWLRYAVQAGGYVGTGVSACDLDCTSAATTHAYIAPLLGTGVRSRTMELRLFAGPRVMRADERTQLGAQSTIDLTIGNQRGALYFPVSWSWHSTNGRTLRQRSIGVGLQIR